MKGAVLFTALGFAASSGLMGQAASKEALPSKPAAEKKPNVVLMLADNIGYGDLGCYGGGPTRGMETPRIDQLSANSIRFTQFCVEPGSTPSRAALLTGRYSIRSGLSTIIVPGTQNTLSADEVTLAEMLKDAGYDTAIYGKWHLGVDEQSLPHNQGFDDYYGILNSSDDTFVRATMAKYHAPQVPDERLPYIVQAKRGGKLEMVKPYTFDTRRTIDLEIADRSVNFIRKEAQAGRLFFLYIPWTRPHFPCYVTKEFEGKSRIGRFGDCMEELDYNVGRVLDALKEAGIEDNTIVIFCSDNGPMTTNVIDQDDAGFAGPYRGELGDPTEGSIRTCGMIRWPNKIKPGVSNEMFSIMDFYPTLAKLTGAALPADRPIDGAEQSDYLLGRQPTGNRESLLTFIGDRIVAVRWRQWRVYMVDTQSTGVGSWKLGGLGSTFTPLVYPEIYNIEFDPREEKNIATTVGWVGVPVVRAIMNYKKTLKDHPNPPAANLTNF